MSDWYGYPQAPGAHPQRPWWTAIAWSRVGDEITVTSWYRHGGHRTGGENLSAIDREHPLPAPPPRCGQVWVWPDGLEPGRAEMVTGHFVCVAGTTTITTDEFCYSTGGGDEDSGCRDWPPSGAVLVAGPGAPWAPPEWEPEDNSG